MLVFPLALVTGAALKRSDKLVIRRISAAAGDPRARADHAVDL
jgi:hypothetical protein